MTRTPTILALGLTCRIALGAAGFQLKSEPAFSWASGGKTYLVDKHVTAAGRWDLRAIPNGSYMLAVGNYRGDRVLHVSVDGEHFKTLFDLDGRAAPSPVSRGVEQTFGPVQIADTTLRVYVYHRANEGIAKFGSYFDYVRLIPDKGGPIVIEAESAVPQIVRDTSGFVIESPRAGFDATRLDTDVPDSEIGTVAEEIHRLLWQKFFDRKTHMLYTLPGGRSTEDCSLYGGVYLAALVEKLGVTGGEETKAECRLILRGLVRNATVTGIPGHLARGIRPNGTWHGDPSVDQYIGWLYGVWRYVRAGLASETERGEIRTIVDDMLTRMERHGFVIMRADGKSPTTFGGDLPALRQTRAERLLAFLLAGYDLTQNARWKKLYEKMKPPRLPVLKEHRGSAWVLIQNMMALRMLWELELEPETEAREVYRVGMKSAATNCLPQINGYRAFPSRRTASPQLLSEFYSKQYRRHRVRGLRNPIEAVATVLLSGQTEIIEKVRPLVPGLLTRYDWPRVPNSQSLVSAEWICWMAGQGGRESSHQSGGIR